MKLDNRGWGYRDMIVYSSIIIICLVIVVVFSKIVHDNIETSPYEEQNKKVDEVEEVQTFSNSSYYEVEKEMQNATFIYLQKYDYDKGDQMRKIALDTLIGFGYISLVRDFEDGSECKGYVTIHTTNQVYTVNPYLKCTHYVTKGYEE